MLFRVVMITTLLLVAIYVETVSETLLPVNPLYFLIAATYGLTLIYALALRFLPHRDVQAYVQVIFDLLVITGLVYLTGGPGSRAGFILLYPISVLSGSVLLYQRKSVALAGVATLLVLDIIGEAVTSASPDSSIWLAILFPLLGFRFPRAHFVSLLEHLKLDAENAYVVGGEIVGGAILLVSWWRRRKTQSS